MKSMGELTKQDPVRRTKTLVKFAERLNRTKVIDMKLAIVMIAHQPKLGKTSYRLAGVIATNKDEAGLVRIISLEVRLPGGKPGLAYVSKDLQQFPMAVERLVFLRPVKLATPSNGPINDLTKDKDPAIESHLALPRQGRDIASTRSGAVYKRE
jgi:hypothetical protein